MIKYLKLIVFILAACAVFVFFYCNISNGTLLYQARFEFSLPPLFKLESAPIPLGLLLIFAFFIGMLLSAFLGLYQTITHKVELRAKHRKINHLEKKVKELENKFPPVDHFPRPVANPSASRVSSAKSRYGEEVADAEFEDGSLFDEFRRDFK